MMLAIDPGPTVCGYAVLSGTKIVDTGVLSVHEMLAKVRGACHSPLLETIAVEMIQSFGMAVGAEVFETCVIIGRIQEACAERGWEIRRVTRGEVIDHVCGSRKAKDSNIRQALIDLFGPQGNKKAPGPTHGVKSHAWAALAVAATAAGLRPGGRHD
jgi:Holliday junction resolvasome RuvABC endonuclease subunit